MKYLFWILCLLALGACDACSTYPSPDTSRSQASQAALLRAETVAFVETSKGIRPYCSGVWVDVSAVLTAAHCVSDFSLGEDAEVSGFGDVFSTVSPEQRTVVLTRKARLTAVDEDHDLALLRVANPPTHVIAMLSVGPIVAGDVTQAMGHSLGLWWSYSSGDVAAIRKMEINGLNIMWVQTTAPVSPGNSGGGLFDEHGLLIGICHGAFTRGELLNVFVHRDHVRDFLARFGS